MSRFLASVIFSLALFLPIATFSSPNSRIQAVAAKVQASNDSPAVDSYREYLASIPCNENSERGYDEDGEPQSDLLTARQVIFNELVSSLGKSSVSWQRFDGNGYAGANIVGILRGQGRNRSSYYMLNAHYDSVENPGADDNPSGVAGLLEAARVLGKYRFDASILFVALDQEEERNNGWGMGSRYCAKKAKRTGMKIKGAISLDCIGFNEQQWDWVAVSRCDARRGSASARLAKEVGRAFRDYSSLHPDYFEEEDSSDPWFFYKSGFPAVLISEELDDDGELTSPYNHELTDFFLSLAGVPRKYQGRNYIDIDYASEVVRGAVGWSASKARLWGAR